MMDKNSIPKHWELTSLVESVDILDNLRKPINSSERQKRISGKHESDLFPYFGATGQVGWIDQYLTDGEFVLVGEDGAPFLDLLKQKAYLITGKTWVNNHAHILKGKSGLTLNKYVLYYLNSLNYSQYVNGTTRLKLTQASLREISFLLPPLSEQQQIVSKIEELFSELDKGKQQLEIVKQQLKTYRQAVLKWAFEGRFTNKNVKDGQLPDGWKWVSLDGLCDSKRKCSYGVLVPGAHDENGIRLIRVGDIDDTGRIDKVNLKKISPVIARKFKRTFLEGDEIVISLVGAIGRTAVVPISLKGANIARAVGVIPISKDISSKFVEMMLRSPSKIKEHNEKAHEVARKTLNLEDVKKSKIPLPPREVQENIVMEIETRLSNCDKMEETIENSLRQVESLRQSILKQAFEGKLV